MTELPKGFILIVHGPEADKVGKVSRCQRDLTLPKNIAEHSANFRDFCKDEEC